MRTYKGIWSLVSVWKSGEKLFIFYPVFLLLIILFENQYQTFDTEFHHKIKHLEVRRT